MNLRATLGSILGRNDPPPRKRTGDDFLRELLKSPFDPPPEDPTTDRPGAVEVNALGKAKLPVPTTRHEARQAPPSGGLEGTVVADVMRSLQRRAPADATMTPRAPGLRTMQALPERTGRSVTDYGTIPEPTTTQKVIEWGASNLPPVDVPMALEGLQNVGAGRYGQGATDLGFASIGLLPMGTIARGAAKEVKALTKGGKLAEAMLAKEAAAARRAKLLTRTPIEEAMHNTNYSRIWTPDNPVPHASPDPFRPTVPDVVGAARETLGESPSSRMVEMLASQQAPAVGRGKAPGGKPTWRHSRGVFGLDAPKIQGTVKSDDPRLLTDWLPNPGIHRSMFVDALLDSKIVRNVLDQDVERGLHMGGPEWYELGNIKADLDARKPGALTFEELNSIGAGASANNSVPNELSGMSIINMMMKQGMTMAEAKRRYIKMMAGNVKKPPLMGSHALTGFDALQEGGSIIPQKPQSNTWKLPSYRSMRMGMGGELDPSIPGNMPALDTHERRRLMQAALQDPQLARMIQELGIPTTTGNKTAMIPLQNANDYQAIGNLYIEGAKRYDLPTSGAYQASRWTGGWDKTGLKSPPYGDFQQLLEDALAFTAMKRRMDTSPRGLRSLWGRVVKGEDVIAPFNGKGGYPVQHLNK